MREVLFRGKTKTGIWIEGFLFQTECDGVKEWNISMSPLSANDYSEILGDYGDVIPETVGQYTGLTDKNGKKIFDGDIVKVVVNRHVCDKIDVREEKGLIDYDAMGMLSLVLYFHNDVPIYSDVFNELSLSSCVQDFHFELIGNIHDNPELLKGAENNG